MEKFDPEMAARVWQRVQSKEPAVLAREDPEPLHQLLRELAALYDALAGLLPGGDGDRVRQLRREARAGAACVRGLWSLSGRQLPASPPVPVPREPARRLLEKCCHRERRLIAACGRQSLDPDWGPVYSRLAADAGRRCVEALTLLGNAQK